MTTSTTSQTTIDDRAPNNVTDLFPVTKPVIGTVHALPLPGSPRYGGESMAHIVNRAVKDAEDYVAGGVDGLIVENAGDIPFRHPRHLGPDTVAGLTAVAMAVRGAVDIPIGIICVAHGVIQSIAVAKAVDAQFIRANQWVNAYVANEGFIEGSAAEALRFRAALLAEEIQVFADVHVKHGSHAIVGDRSIAELTYDTEAFDADVLIATGNRTGDPTRLEELQAIKNAASRPVLVGSGLNQHNSTELLGLADGAIVGSAMKQEGVWWKPVDPYRVSAIMDAVNQLR
ncbi:BtpA/SgcQ family protein [soil metagenome]